MGVDDHSLVIQGRASPLRVAPMQREDLDAVMEIERRCFASPWSRGLFLHELKVPFSRSLTVWISRGGEEIVVGYLCRWLVGDEIHILNLAIDPAHRREGIGRALVDLVLAEAGEREISQVTLEVRQENVGARALYRSLAFVECGRRRNYYGRGEDAIIMTWRPLQVG